MRAMVAERAEVVTSMIRKSLSEVCSLVQWRNSHRRRKISFRIEEVVRVSCFESLSGLMCSRGLQVR